MIRTLKVSALTIPFALVFMFAGQADAQDKKTAEKVVHFSPTGTWNWERKAGDATVKCELIVSKKKDGTFSGKYEDKDHKLDIKNAKLEEGSFSFEVAPRPDSPKMVIQFNGKVAADSIKGKMSYPVGDETKSTDWLAKRSDPMKAALGKWFLEFETPDGTEIQFTINVKKKGNGVSVSFVDDESAETKKVKFKKNVLSFDTEQDYQGQPLDVEWDLKIDGNQLDGTLYYAFQNSAEEGEIEVIGERVK